jgi:cation transport regulator
MPGWHNPVSNISGGQSGIYFSQRMKGDEMPYEKVKDLPDSVKENLPRHAQEIYQSAYNSAYETYDHDESRAHRVAWAAVKHQYEKDEETGKWKEKNK